MDKFKPCPFCGGTDIIALEEEDAAWCEGCDCYGPSESGFTWNDRHNEIKRTKERERIFNALWEEKSKLQEEAISRLNLENEEMIRDIAIHRTAECNYEGQIKNLKRDVDGLKREHFQANFINKLLLNKIWDDENDK